MGARDAALASTLSTTAMQFGRSRRTTDQAPILVLRGERSRAQPPLPGWRQYRKRQLMTAALLGTVTFVPPIVFAAVWSIVTSDWWYLRIASMGELFVFVLALYITIRRVRRSRIEVLSDELRVVNNGRTKSVPMAEVGRLVRGNTQVGQTGYRVFAVLVIGKDGRTLLSLSHHIDVELLADTIGVPVTGRFEDRIPQDLPRADGSGRGHG